MAKISESNGRGDENSGYSRLFGNPHLGHLISKVQAAVIRTGNELEEVLAQQTPSEMKASLEQAIFYQGGRFSVDKQVVFKPKMPASADARGVNGDIAVFDHKRRTAMVIELKDGDTFDTKKSAGELASMIKLANWIAQETGYTTDYYFCSFNQVAKAIIVNGAKRVFDISHAMTGRELCEILSIDYDDVKFYRQSAQQENLIYFLTELVKISAVRKILVQLLSQ